MVKGKKEAALYSYKFDAEKEMDRQKKLKQLMDLETSSNTSTESVSTEPYMPMEEEYEEEEEDLIDMLDTLYETDTESLQKEEPDYLLGKPLESEVNFFEALQEIPDVQSVSENISSISVVVPKPPPVITDSSGDLGKFVNPLTGDVMYVSEESKSTEDIIVQTTVDVQPAISVENVVESDGSDFYLPDDIYEDYKDIKRITAAEDTFETFLEMEVQKVAHIVDDVDWEAVAKEHELKRIQRYTMDFLADLIKRVVDAVEYVSPETILRQNADKLKLLNELLANLALYNVEKSVCQFLNRKIVQYYRRKKTFRPITPDNPKTSTRDKMKFKNVLVGLDNKLQKESKLNKSTTEIIGNLKTKYEEAKEEAETQVQLFERIVKAALYRDNSPKTNALTELFLSRINKYRKEVNEVRFVMFMHQHSQARLTEELFKLEDLGNGLSMRDFGNLQAETTTLDKKIEERNIELNKLHIRCRSDIHTMAHYKEKQRMLRNAISVQNSVLDTLLDNKCMLRERLLHMKLQHKNLRSQIKNLSFQGGLLDKPALMHDYDATVEQLRKQRLIIDDLRESLQASQQKIDDIAKLCPELKL